MTTTFTDVVDYIDQADETEIDTAFTALRNRQKALRDRRALAVIRGAEVTLTDLSPKCLNGLHGIVAALSGKRASVRLDAASTATLRQAGSRRFYIPAEEDEYLVTGIPTSCCQVD